MWSSEESMLVGLYEPADDEGIHRWKEPIVYRVNRLFKCGVV